MMNVINLFEKAIQIVVNRLRTQGLETTIIWFFVRSITFITGIPFTRYSRITPRIFVGPQIRRAGKRKLERLGINSSVNLRSEFDDAVHKLTFDHYCYLPTIDDEEPSIAQLKRGIEFIHRITNEGGKVYIHCAGGIGRAPTLAAAFFINQGYKLDEAIALIKESRPFISITSVQMDRLREFEVMHREHDWVTEDSLYGG